MRDPDTALLALDAGNTRIKWGVHDGHAWSARGTIDTAQSGSLYEAMRNALPVDRAIASNVAGTQVRAHIGEACARAGIAVDFIAAMHEQCGVRSSYADPAQLGADRWAALIAAHHGETGHKLVVNAGTALTVDALSASGEFLGGLIVPGPALMRRSLDRGTAGLRLTEGAFRSLPRSTPDAITSGSLQACVGAIDRLGKAMASHAAAPDRIILSGGAAKEIEAMLPYVHTCRENLVLEGLLLIARS
ncbi:MAG TPA: type III pantothenate kinase [Usitatibacter sp.]|nr:type III pantothenate kinase [Usitatibacter sp.]